MIAFLGWIVSCTNDNGETTNNGDTTEFRAKLLKRTTVPGLGETNYFYNEQDKLILITKVNSRTAADSTFLQYNNGVLSQVEQKIYSPFGGITNIEIIFAQFTSTGASGTYTVFDESGNAPQEQTFEYTFSDNLMKSANFFRSDGSKNLERIYIHDENGNLTQWDQKFYRPGGTVHTERSYTFTEWDANGLSTKSLFYWTYNMDIFQDIQFTKNNCLNLIDGDEIFTYSFSYDPEGNVTNYNAIEAGQSMTLEYYD